MCFTTLFVTNSNYGIINMEEKNPEKYSGIPVLSIQQMCLSAGQL